MTQDTPASPKRRSLGRGLDALFGDGAADTAAPADPSPPAGQQQDMRRVPVAWLEPNPYQPRSRFDEAELADLVASVKVQGVIQPLLVRPSPGQDARYQIIAGERRWRAAQRAQLHDVPVHIKELTDDDALHLAIIENVQRADLSAIEEARGYRQLIEQFGHTQQQLSEIIGKSRSHIANLLRLLELPAEVQERVMVGTLSAGHARALIGSADPRALAEEVIADGLSVRQTEALVRDRSDRSDGDRARRGGRPPGGARTAAHRRDGADKDADTLALEEQLSGRLGLTVQISPRGQAGAVTLHYQTLEQLDGLLRVLSGSND